MINPNLQDGYVFTYTFMQTKAMVLTTTTNGANHLIGVFALCSERSRDDTGVGLVRHRHRRQRRLSGRRDVLADHDVTAVQMKVAVLGDRRKVVNVAPVVVKYTQSSVAELFCR